MMHYYSFNIADYKKDTEHLTPIEHYIYRSLIDRYYLDEKPISLKTQLIMRRLSLHSAEHEKMLKNVLDDFFDESNNGFYHKRIDEELEKYQANSAKNRINGAKGGRPPKNKPKLTQSVAKEKPVASQINPNQEPLTTNQEPLTNTNCGGVKELNISFEIFWKTYSKSAAKNKCEAKWISLSNKVRDQIMQHLPAYVASTPVKKFRKDPYTYLNGKGWLDDIIDNTPSINKKATSYGKMDVNAIYDDPNHDPLQGLFLKQGVICESH
ncbi:YdaU family protein [Psychrobacter sp. R86515]|uniref:YdaU family protein n=1 Tax=Psychrobacter sp. R86515 TaxID=3093855 RepID=UPI0036D2DD58